MFDFKNLSEAGKTVTETAKSLDERMGRIEKSVDYIEAYLSDIRDMVRFYLESKNMTADEINAEIESITND